MSKRARSESDNNGEGKGEGEKKPLLEPIQAYGIDLAIKALTDETVKDGLKRLLSSYPPKTPDTHRDKRLKNVSDILLE
jgi:hypothetical protein